MLIHYCHQASVLSLSHYPANLVLGKFNDEKGESHLYIAKPKRIGAANRNDFLSWIYKLIPLELPASMNEVWPSVT